MVSMSNSSFFFYSFCLTILTLLCWGGSVNSWLITRPVPPNDNDIMSPSMTQREARKLALQKSDLGKQLFNLRKVSADMHNSQRGGMTTGEVRQFSDNFWNNLLDLLERKHAEAGGGAVTQSSQYPEIVAAPTASPWSQYLAITRPYGFGPWASPFYSMSSSSSN